MEKRAGGRCLRLSPFLNVQTGQRGELMRQRGQSVQRLIVHEKVADKLNPYLTVCSFTVHRISENKGQASGKLA